MQRSELSDFYAFLFSRRCFYRLNCGLFHASLRGLGLLNYKNQVVSGERSFLKRYLKSGAKQIVFDVGANEGSYSASILAANGNAQVFAFEPHPLTYQRLLTRLTGTSNVTTVNAACGSVSGQAVLYDYAGSQGSSHASLHAGVIEVFHNATAVEHVVDVIDLDSFAASRGISSVDLLKIDTEGNELEVLKGTADLLRGGRIKAIQFEFSEMNIASRVFLKDIFDLLPNYKFFRLLRDGLGPLDPYTPLRCELFGFQNIVALPRV